MKCFCGQTADGLDGMHCDRHWEELCDRTFFDFAQASDRGYWLVALARARSDFPDFDTLPL